MKEKEDVSIRDKDFNVNSTFKPRVYKTRKFIRSNMTTRSLVDTVSYVKDRKDGSLGNYVVVHHSPSRHTEKSYKHAKKKAESFDEGEGDDEGEESVLDVQNNQ